MSIGDITRARDLMFGADTAGEPIDVVVDHIVRAFHHVIRFDWCAFMTTDTETLLPTGGVVEGFPPEACAPFWDTELLDPDFIKLNALARSTDPVATLVSAVDGDLDRSPRWRKLYEPLGAADELRVAFVAGSSCLAVAVFLRAADDGPYTDAEVADVRTLTPMVTSVIRRALGRHTDAAASHPPVVVILDAEGELVDVSAGGDAVLDELRTRGSDDPGLPSTVRAAAIRARSSRVSTTLATRLQGRSGRWLRLNVTPMSGVAGYVAVTIEQAHPNDLVPILLDAYGLTDRETEIVVLLARGLSTKEIATELIISAHTVRDHVKAIYEKAGVNSRGELVANLFSHHMWQSFHDSVTHLSSPAAN